MTARRSHIVRTDDQGGAAVARSLGGCEIFCANEPCGNVNQGDSVLLAPITITSSRDFQRVFVSATLGGVYASVPDPPPLPGPGEWAVRFEYTSEVPYPQRWQSIPYTPGDMAGDAVITKVEFGGNVQFNPGNGTGIWRLGPFGEFLSWWEFSASTLNPEYPNPPVPPPRWPIRLQVNNEDGPVWCELFMSSPHGENEPDFTSTDDGTLVD